MRPRWVWHASLSPHCMSLCVNYDLFPPPGPGVQDAACRPSPTADSCSGASPPLGDAQRPAAQIHPEQTGCPTPGQGGTCTHTHTLMPPNPKTVHALGIISTIMWIIVFHASELTPHPPAPGCDGGHLLSPQQERPPNPGTSGLFHSGPAEGYEEDHLHRPVTFGHTSTPVGPAPLFLVIGSSDRDSADEYRNR